MKFATLGGALALLLMTTGAFAEDYVGGAIKTMEIGGKQVLTDANGMTLYTFDKDTPGVSNCYDDCAVKWPPLFAADDATDSGEFTVVTRTDGTKMWAHEGWPLYLWIKDTAPGETTGDMVGGVWHTATE
jgi:predicted lipoprotein with Yx(FWY)xxD motif